jgi:hypothetical protein
MAIINNKNDKLSEAQQKEIIGRLNDAYDRGGADVLKIVVETVKQIAIDTPEYSEFTAFTLYVVEAIRQKLSEVVNEQHDQIPEKKMIVDNAY